MLLKVQPSNNDKIYFLKCSKILGVSKPVYRHFITRHLITRHLITIGLGFRVKDETLNHVRVRVRIRVIDSSPLAISSCYTVYVIRCLVIKCP